MSLRCARSAAGLHGGEWRAVAETGRCQVCDAHLKAPVERLLPEHTENGPERAAGVGEIREQ